MSRACRRLIHGFCVAATIALAACGGGSGSSSPAAPTPAPAPAPAAPTVTALTVTGPGCVAGVVGTEQLQTLCTAEERRPGDTLQLTATATLSDSTTQDVSSQAQWTSTNQNVATVNASGLVTLLATGESDVVAAYQGKSAGHTVRTKLKLRYSGTTSQAQPIVLHTYVIRDPYSGDLRQVTDLAYTIMHRFSDGTVEGGPSEIVRSCTEDRVLVPNGGGTGVFSCTWELPLPPPLVGNLRTLLNATYQADGSIAGTLEDTGIGRPPGFERVQTVVNFTVRRD